MHAIMHSFFIITQHYLFSKQKTEPDTQALLILLVLFEKTHAVFIPLCLLRLRRLRLMNRLCKRVRHIVLALLAKSSRADRLPAGLTDNAVCALTQEEKADKTLFETSLRDFLKNEKLAANVTLYTDEKTFLNRVRGLAANFDDTDKRSMDRMEWITHAMKNMCL